MLNLKKLSDDDRLAYERSLHRYGRAYLKEDAAGNVICVPVTQVEVGPIRSVWRAIASVL